MKKREREEGSIDRGFEEVCSEGPWLGAAVEARVVCLLVGLLTCLLVFKEGGTIACLLADEKL